MYEEDGVDFMEREAKDQRHKEYVDDLLLPRVLRWHVTMEVRDKGSESPFRTFSSAVDAETEAGAFDRARLEMSEWFDVGEPVSSQQMAGGVPILVAPRGTP